MSTHEGSPWLRNFVGRAIALLLLVAAATHPAFATQDTTPPVLNSFTFSPMQVDVTKAPANVTVTAQVSDDLSGASYALAVFTSPTGLQQAYGGMSLLSGNGLNGTWQGTATVTPFSEPGTWTVTYLEIDDYAQNRQVYHTSDLQALGFPTNLEVVSNPDMTPPVLNSFTFSPMQVDVTKAPANVTVTAQVSDDLSGASYALAVFTSPTGLQQAYGGMSLLSGNGLNGTWQGTATVTPFSEPGTWTVTYLEIDDYAQNRQVYHTSDLQALGFPTNLEVVSNPDMTPPVLNNFTFSPMQVDVTKAPANVTVTAQVSDDLSGASYALAVFTSPTGLQQAYGGMSLLSGNGLNGTWQGTATVTPFSEPGTWTVTYLEIDDYAQNRQVYHTSDLQALGFPTNLEVIDGSSVALTSSVNPSAYNQPITFTATVTGGSGTPTGTVNFNDGSTFLGSGTLNANGVAVFTTSTLSVGSHIIIADYLGDANNPPGSSSPMNQVVNRAASNTFVTSSDNPSRIGMPGTLIATVAGQFGGSPTGTVTFTIGDLDLGTAHVNAGQARLDGSPWRGGRFTITGSYSGDANYLGSTSAPYLQKVGKAISATEISSNLNPSHFGDSVTFTATVSSDIGSPNGEWVIFADGRTELGRSKLSGGTAVLTTSTLEAGTHYIRAGYHGDRKLGRSLSAPVVQVVVPAPVRR